MDMVTMASLAIESMKDEEIKRTGLDPSALSMLPELVLYNQWDIFRGGLSALGHIFKGNSHNQQEGETPPPNDVRDS